MTDLASSSPLEAHLNQSSKLVYSSKHSSYDEPGVRYIRRHLEKTQNISEDAFMVVDLGAVKKAAWNWNNQLPRVKAHYAVKCNPNDEIMSLIRDMGTGFDCASISEIDLCLKLGVDPEEIIFANPCKMPSHVSYARERGVHLMTFDNVAELEKVARCNPSAQMVLRILADDSHSVCRFGTKFGAPQHHVPALLRKARELDVDVVGVSFHVGSGCLSASAFVEAVELAYETFRTAEALGFSMTLLDIGGGFPGFDGAGPSFADIAASLREVLDELFPEECGVRIIAEPGRFFTAASHTLATCVYARRDIVLEAEEPAHEHHKDAAAPPSPAVVEGAAANEDDELHHLYYISDGVYGSFNCLVFDHACVMPRLVRPRKGPLYRANVFGPTCDSFDLVAKDVMLPKMEIGDWLYFENMGAYTISASSEFNGFHKPEIHYIDSTI